MCKKGGLLEKKGRLREKKRNGEERKTSMEEITLQVNKSDPKGGKTVQASQERRQRKKWVHSLLFFLLENFPYLFPPSRSQEGEKRKEIEKKDGGEKNEKIATCRHDDESLQKEKNGE